MKIAEVKKLEFKSAYPELTDLSNRLDKQKERLLIETINWEAYRYKPEVMLSLGYSDREIFLKFYVTENYFKAEKTETNQMVREDSCVEFFVSSDNSSIYYNFEFNAIGTCLMEIGTGRADRKRADPGVISKVRRLASSGDKPVKEKAGTYSWTLTIAIPFEVFVTHKIKDVKGITFRANFYKCGDMLTVPHYVTWNPVGTEKPDYHRPEFFGLLRFV